MINDLRDFIESAKQIGEYKLIEGADWDLEISVIGELMATTPNSPLLEFDRIKGYKEGLRVVLNVFASARRTALGYGLPPEAKGIELVRALKDKLKSGVKLTPPVEVDTGPIKENVHTGIGVNLFMFPTPKWHELDGGRYIGTGSLTVTRDPDEGWVNLGAYRTEIIDKDTALINISPGHHGRIIREKYWAKGQACPAAVICGQEPMLFAAGQFEVPWGVSEYDYAGGLKGKPIEVTRGVFTDLPIPATAEIVLEGQIMPPEFGIIKEGPFGDFLGYYTDHAAGGRPTPMFKVKAILHRNNPIIQGCPPSRFASIWSLGRHIQACAAVWDELDRQIPGVKGVWSIEDAAFRSITVISLKQMYGGHAKQAALLALGSNANMRTSRYIMIVDEDIDPSNTSEVLWALGTRTDPKRSIEFIDECWGFLGNAILSKEQISRGEIEYSRAIILACKPYHRIHEYMPSIKTSPELLNKTRQKWAKLFP